MAIAITSAGEPVINYGMEAAGMQEQIVEKIVLRSEMNTNIDMVGEADQQKVQKPISQ